MFPKYLTIILSSLLLLLSCSDQPVPQTKSNTVSEQEEVKGATDKPLITFIELGSVKCVPCQKMQPVMRSLEQNYGAQLKVIFYDVWQADQKPKAREYGIRLIPTQVFLDSSGAEIFRHEGFFPEQGIDLFLQNRGLRSGNSS